MGIAVFVMIFTYVRFETSYDKHFENSERIYRISLSFPEDALERAIATNFPVVHRTFPDLFPEIEKSTRIFNDQFSGSKCYLTIDNKQFSDEKLYYADSTFFEVFKFNFISGKSIDALNGKNKVVITQEAAFKYFGNSDCIGKPILLNNKVEYLVSGVIESLPSNTHFNFDVLASMESHPWEKDAEWNGLVFATYFLLYDGTDIAPLNKKIDDHLISLNKSAGDDHVRMPLIPITEIHLNSHMDMELEANGEYRYVMIFSLIAIFILIIACINYINLATSRGMDRAREVGLRKVFGAYRWNLIVQFIGESMIMVIASFIVSIGVVSLVSPYFNDLINTNFSFWFFYDERYWIYYLLGAVLLGIIAGIYPAFFLSRYKPEQVMKGKYNRSKPGIRLRKSLVITQFFISVVLIIGSLVVYRQLDYMMSKDLGMVKDHVIAIPFNNSILTGRLENVKENFTSHHSILSGTAVSQLPINVTFSEGLSDNMSYSDEDVDMNIIHVDKDFFKTMDIQVELGKEFTRSYSPDHTEYMVNKAGMDLLGEDNSSILNRNIRMKHGGVTLGPIVGVVGDFNFASLHNDIGPLAISQNPGWYEWLLFRVNPTDLNATISFMKSKWETTVPELPFEFSFLDQEFDRIYRTEQKLSEVFIIFTTVAILIACFGLFGLSSFETLQRTKEIGIRRVLGATAVQVVLLFIKENIKLVIIALFLAIPFGYYIMDSWLQGFAFRINIGISTLVIASLFVMMITVLTVTYHAIRTSIKDPSTTLRYE